MKTNNTNKKISTTDKKPIIVCSLITLALIVVFSLSYYYWSNADKKQANNEHITMDEADSDLLNDPYMYMEPVYDVLDDYTVASMVIKSDSDEFEDISFTIHQQTEIEDFMRGYDYFLNHNIDGSEGYPGQIFTESAVSRDFLGFNQFNTVVYGHNMKSGEAFGWIRSLLDDDTFKAYNKVYVYYTNGSVARYTLNCLSVVSNEELTQQFNNFEDDSDRTDFLKYVYDNATNSRSEYSDDLTNNSRYITLSTCLGDDSKRRVALLEYDGSIYVDHASK